MAKKGLLRVLRNTQIINLVAKRSVALGIAEKLVGMSSVLTVQGRMPSHF
ncbi:MAG: hypothetical protein V1837_00760 [Candidatus Woesearchaeota archaeon]